MSIPATVYPNSNTWVGCALETVRGVAAAAPAFWVPIIEPAIRPSITELEDRGVRGQMNARWDQVKGPEYVVFEFKCLAHVDVLPHLFRSVLGSPDTVTGTGPYSHVLSLLNNNPPDQPPTYTWFDYDGYRVRVLRGGQTDQVKLSWRADGLVKVSARIFAFPFTVLPGAVPSASISKIPPTTEWDCSTTINGSLRTTVVSGDLTLDRHVVAIKTLGSQVPYSLFADALDVQGNGAFLNQDDTELNIFLNNTAVALAMDFKNVALQPYGFTLNMSNTKASGGGEERGSTGLITAILTLLPLPNVSDATAGGASPMKATFRSPQAAAY